MKFAETLSTHLTPEWRKQYITYSILKQMILNAIANTPADMDLRSTEYRNYLAKFDEEFFQKCEEELLKIGTFFAEKQAEAKRKYRELNSEVELATTDAGRKKDVSSVDLSRVLPKRKAKELKLALSEYYLSLILLRNYQTLNCTGFRKILKKHDKKFNLPTGAKWYKTHVDTADFSKNTDIESLIEETELMFTNSLEKGDRSRAMKHLRVPPFEELPNPWRTFRLGFALGTFTCLLFFLYFSATTTKLTEVEYMSCLRLHRGSFMIILFIFLIGLNIHGWQKAGVNHILIFEINPRDHLTAVNLMEIAAYFGVLWALSLLACLNKLPAFIHPFLFPVILHFLMILYWITPIPIQWTSRFWLLKVVGRIICAPFFAVGFSDFWLGDQLVSLANIFLDYQFIACLCLSYSWTKNPDAFFCLRSIGHITSAVIWCLPAWFRFAQSLRRYHDTKRRFPFLYNAGKYATNFPIAGFSAVMQTCEGHYNSLTDNPYFWCLLVFRIISTVYSYLWDVLMDFGLFKKFSGENIFLRDEIIYNAAFYYFAIIEDLLLRCIWILSFIAQEYNLLENFHLFTITEIAEVLRRYIWNYFRLEHEHLNNAGQFRAVRDISVKLVLSDDQKRLENMMDERDGVYNRQSEKRESNASDED